MATKTTFDFNSKTITNSFQKVFNILQDSRLGVYASTGKQWMNVPVLFALVIGIIFPFIVIATVILVLFSVIKITISRETGATQRPKNIIEIK